MSEGSLETFNNLIWKTNSRNLASLLNLSSDQATDSLILKTLKTLKKLLMKWTENPFKALKWSSNGLVKIRKRPELETEKGTAEMVPQVNKKSASTAAKRVTGLMNVKKAAGRIVVIDAEILVM